MNYYHVTCFRLPYLKIHGKLGQLAKPLIQSHQVLHCVDEGAPGLFNRFVQL